MVLLGQQGQQLFQHRLYIPNQGQIHADVFVHFRRVNVDLQNLGIFGKGGFVPDDTVAEPGTQAHEQIAVFNGLGGGDGAVHPQHSHIPGVGVVKAALSHQRRGHRGVHAVDQLQHRFRRFRSNDAAAGVDEGALGFHDQSCRPLQFVGSGVIFHRNGLGLFGGVLALSRRNVLGNVDEHRAFPPGIGQVKGFPDSVRQLSNVLDNVIVLGDGNGDPSDVHFLEGVQAQGRTAHIAGNGYHRHRVHIGGGQAGNQVGGPGAGGGDHHAGAAGAPGVAVGGMAGALFVGGEDVADFVAVFIQRIVDVQHRTAGITEHRVHTLLQQAFQNDFCSS